LLYEKNVLSQSSSNEKRDFDTVNKIIWRHCGSFK